MNFGSDGINSASDLYDNGWSYEEIYGSMQYNNEYYATGDDYLQFYVPGTNVGWIEQTLPSGYSRVKVTWGAGNTGQVELFIGGVSQGTVTGVTDSDPEWTNTAVTYSAGDIIRLQEVGVAIISSIEVC